MQGPTEPQAITAHCPAVTWYQHQANKLSCETKPGITEHVNPQLHLMLITQPPATTESSCKMVTASMLQDEAAIEKMFMLHHEDLHYQEPSCQCNAAVVLLFHLLYVNIKHHSAAHTCSTLRVSAFTHVAKSSKSKWSMSMFCKHRSMTVNESTMPGTVCSNSNKRQ